MLAGRSPGPSARLGCEERPSGPRTAPRDLRAACRRGSPRRPVTRQHGQAGEPSFTAAPRHSFKPLVPISRPGVVVPRKCHSRPVGSNSDPRDLPSGTQSRQQQRSALAEGGDPGWAQPRPSPASARRSRWRVPRWATWPPRTPPSWPPRPRPSACGGWSGPTRSPPRRGRRSCPRSPSGKGYSADADYSARAWLMHRTGITRGAAASHTAWARRAGTHPGVVAALAAGEVSESYGRTICQWTDGLPEKYREESDELAGQGRGGRAGAGGPVRAVRGNVRAGPRPTCPMRTRTGRSPTGACGWRPRSRAPG